MGSADKRWVVEISRTAEKQIQKLDRKAQKSIIKFLRERVEPADEPRQWGKPLRGEKRDLWRYRVGDYRLIRDIQNEDHDSCTRRRTPKGRLSLIYLC